MEKKNWFVWLLMLGLFTPVIGCEAEGDVDLDDDDDAALRVDVEDE